MLRPTKENYLKERKELRKLCKEKERKLKEEEIAETKKAKTEKKCGSTSINIENQGQKSTKTSEWRNGVIISELY